MKVEGWALGARMLRIWGWLSAVGLVLCILGLPVEAKVDRQNRPLTLIPDALIEPGPGDDNFIIVVEKATQQLYMLEFRKGQYYLLYSLPCTTGEKIGDKEMEGDKKTPEGFYLINKKSLENELAPIYGVLAFPMDYPNFWDRHLGKSGSGIWLHGTNRARVPLDTNGCIALENIDLIRLENLLQVNSTPVVVYDEITYKNLEEINEEAAGIKTFINKWLISWRHKDFKTYKSCYAKDFISDDNKGYRAWMDHKKRLNRFYSKIQIEIGNLRIFRHQGMIAVLFDQDYRGDGNFVSQGIKRLYLREKRGDYKIVAEVWNPMPPPPDQRYLSAEVRQRIIDQAKKERQFLASLPKKINRGASTVGKGKATPTKAILASKETGDTSNIEYQVSATDIRKIEGEPVEAPEFEDVAEPPAEKVTQAPEPAPVRDARREEEGPLDLPEKTDPVPQQNPSAADEPEADLLDQVASLPEPPAGEPRTPEKLPVTPMETVDQSSGETNEAGVRETIKDWLTAWRDKNLDDYIDYYHASFRYNGMNLREYKDYKREINKKYRNISIDVAKMNIEIDGARALVTFIQKYRSDQYEDYGLKTLILQKSKDNTWKIRKESWKDMSGSGRS